MNTDPSGRAALRRGFGRWLERTAGSNSARGMVVLALVSAVCCQEEVSTMANHSSKGVLPCVVCIIKCALEKFQQRGGLGRNRVFEP
jgi:hypothetical protein